ncbi:MAG: hypothetical protein EOP00_02995 [Pedobacter sp.]|nr:MAG: hypothetical protein EOP00_02995 [Pedobacter sp.]
MTQDKIKHSSVVKENDIRGEKIIFDILIKEKLAHVILIRDNNDYHINLDGEDLGYFTKNEDGKVDRFPQHKGAHLDDKAYFKPIEDRIIELEKSNPNGLIGKIQTPNEKEVISHGVTAKDGLDNTGTQGYDSLTDDAFTGSSQKPSEHLNETESRTGSSSADFHYAKEDKP